MVYRVSVYIGNDIFQLSLEQHHLLSCFMEEHRTTRYAPSSFLLLQSWLLNGSLAYVLEPRLS